MPEDNVMMTGNKGEWSELYVFLKLLAEGRIYAANERLERIDTIYYPILKIMREEERGRVIEYVIRDEDNIDIRVNGEVVMSALREDAAQAAVVLWRDILNGRGRSFEVSPGITRFANGIEVRRLKAPSRDTADIFMRIINIRTDFEQNVGFSVKSEAGSPPTLFNASPATSFIYRVTGISWEEAEEINSIDGDERTRHRMNRIGELGGIIEFVGLQNEIFQRNLNMLDTGMSAILANMLVYYYRDGVSSCQDLVEMLGREDPLHYGETIVYKHKVGEVLCAFALGMKAASPWNGIAAANGGYIVAKAGGDVLAYHIQDRDTFKSYLLTHTRLERGSVGRHHYMDLYEDAGHMYLKMNLQVRFKSLSTRRQ